MNWVKIIYFINAIPLVFGAYLISKGEVKSGFYLIWGFFILCIVSYLLLHKRELNKQEAKE